MAFVAIIVLVAINTPFAAHPIEGGALVAMPSVRWSANVLSPPSILASTSAAFDALTGSTHSGLTVVRGVLILVFVSAHYVTTAGPIRDSSGNTYQKLAAAQSGTQTGLSVWSTVSSASSSSLVVTANLSRIAPTVISVVVVSGASASPIDAVGPAATNTHSASVAAMVTPLHAPDLLLLGAASTGAPTVTAGAGMTLLDQLTERAGSVNQAGSILFTTASTTSPATLAAQLSSIEAWAAVGVAVEPPQGPPVPSYPVGGWVRDGSDQPIIGATVTASDGGNPHVTITALNGSFSFELPNGSYVLNASSPGFLSASRNITVYGAPLSNEDFPLARAPGPPLPGNGTIQHVVVIILENEPLKTVLSEAPYERYLAAQYGNASKFYAVCHPSSPNYLALTAGYPFQCGSDRRQVYATFDLPDLLDARGLSWAGYFENMSGPCSLSNNVTYVAHHNPFLYYADVVENASNPTRCAAHDLPAKNWTDQVDSGTLLNYSLYIPNNLDNGENTSVVFADQWLKGFLAPLLNSTAEPLRTTIAHTAFFILYDESLTGDGSGYNGTRGGHIYCVVVSPDSRGITFTADATDYSVLSTIEWLFGLGSTGHYDGTSKFPAMKAVFDFSA